MSWHFHDFSANASSTWCPTPALLVETSFLSISWNTSRHPPGNVLTARTLLHRRQGPGLPAATLFSESVLGQAPSPAASDHILAPLRRDKPDARRLPLLRQRILFAPMPGPSGPTAGQGVQVVTRTCEACGRPLFVSRLSLSLCTCRVAEHDGSSAHMTRSIFSACSWPTSTALRGHHPAVDLRGGKPRSLRRHQPTCPQTHLHPRNPVEAAPKLSDIRNCGRDHAPSTPFPA